MNAGELRNFSPDELSARVKQWKDELFRWSLKTQSQEARDTSIVRKLRRDIARALTVLNEKKSGKVIAGTPVAEGVVQDKPTAKKASGAKKKKS
jgi:large subunit ribosomal protein L29